MFGYVMANLSELSKEERNRYSAVYCGICRKIRACASNTARLGLQYDMAFLALLLMSLYEPEEKGGKSACMLHPWRHWTDNRYIEYAADMNVALAYYKCMDDYADEGKYMAKVMAGVFEKAMPRIQKQYPRQCKAMEEELTQLQRLEREQCANADEPAACFGRLMVQIFVYEEDLWKPLLEQMGYALGRYIYLADAAADFRRDQKKKQYNPYIAMGTGENWDLWEQYLVLAMGRCTDYYERLPLVQDKAILDNILYSGVWVSHRRKGKTQTGGTK